MSVQIFSGSTQSCIGSVDCPLALCATIRTSAQNPPSQRRIHAICLPSTYGSKRSPLLRTHIATPLRRRPLRGKTAWALMTTGRSTRNSVGNSGIDRQFSNIRSILVSCYAGLKCLALWGCCPAGLVIRAFDVVECLDPSYERFSGGGGCGVDWLGFYSVQHATELSV